MTTVVHLQNAFNKIVEEVKVDALDRCIIFIKERLEGDTTAEEVFAKIDDLLAEFKASNVTNIINFGPRKKEKKTRPPNSYNLFIKQQMQEIKAVHPEYKGKELMKKATEAWNRQKASSAILNQEIDQNPIT
jgi:hypothetical protein